MTGVAASKSYRARLKASGKCPHCGKPCAPFFECPERREYKNAHRRAKSKFNRKSSPNVRMPRTKLRYWTHGEDEELVSMFKSGSSFKSMCLKFDRPPFGIYARLRRLGIKMPSQTIALLSIVCGEKI